MIVGQRPGRVDLYGASARRARCAWRDVAGAPFRRHFHFPAAWFGWRHLVLSRLPTGTRIPRPDDLSRGWRSGAAIRSAAKGPPPGERLLQAHATRARSRARVAHSRRSRLRSGMRDWYVARHQRRAGEIDAPVRLYGSDLESQIPPRCAPDEDGWLVTPEFGLPPLSRPCSR